MCAGQVAKVEVSAEGNPATGEDAVALAGRFFKGARDKSSCLGQALKDEFAGVKALWTDASVDQQVRAGGCRCSLLGSPQGTWGCLRTSRGRSVVGPSRLLRTHSRPTVA